MAKLITGTRPKITVKTYAREYSNLLMMESRGDIMKEARGAAASSGVPEEATLAQEHLRETDVTRFTWSWWEITLDA